MSVPCSVVTTRGARLAQLRRQHLLGQERRRGVRHGVVRVHDVEAEIARHLHHLVGDRQQVLRLAEQRIGRRQHLVERQARLIVAEPERRLRADDVHPVAADGQRLAELRGDDAAAADRGVTDDADVHGDPGVLAASPVRSRCGRTERLPHHESFRERHAGLRAELRVAALDQLLKAARRQPRGHRVRRRPARTGVTWHASARRFIS